MAMPKRAEQKMPQKPAKLPDLAQVSGASAIEAGSSDATLKTKRRATRAKLTEFDIKSDQLPKGVKEAALTSGGFPYDKKYKRKRYERELHLLHIELLKMLSWVKDKGERVMIVFEGRDGAGKGGAITRFTQHLNPRYARIVALTKPNDAEKGQWYFQRYTAHLPSRGEITFFDRSWYNRAGVEQVMGFTDQTLVDEFLREAPAFEGMLARDGIRVIKLFLTIGTEMQLTRLHARYHDPLKRWKLSPIDFEAISHSDAYSSAFDRLLAQTHIERSPWTVIRANDKLRARLNAIRHVLHAVPYEGKDLDAVGAIDHKIVLNAPDFLEIGGERGASTLA
jgi:polyphosphate kinase